MEGSFNRERSRQKSAYEVLGLTPEATQEEVSLSFRTLASRLHPSAQGGGDEGKFKDLSAAYQEIKTEEKRKAYDSRHGFTSSSGTKSNQSRESSARAETNQDKSVEEMLNAYVKARDAIYKFYGKGDPRGEELAKKLKERVTKLIADRTAPDRRQ